MLALFITSTIVFSLAMVALLVFLGLWTYKDAQVKSEQSPALWVLVVLLVPNLLGVIIYLLVGRSKKDVPAPGTFFKPLIASLVVFVLSIIFFVVGIVGFVFSEAALFEGNMAMNSGVWSGHSSRYWDGQRTISARRGNGTSRVTHTLNAQEMHAFHVDSSNSAGELVLILSQGDTSLYTDISGHFNGTINLHDAGFEPGRIGMTLRFVHARDVSTIISWRVGR